MTASPPPKDNPGVIAPPPFIFLGFLVAGWGLDRALHTPAFPLDDMVRKGLAVALIVLGLGLEGWAGTRFRQAGTNIVPYSPATALVTDGPYRFTRNPMYLGFALTYIGLAVGLNAPIALALLLPCLLVMSGGVIKREERYLEARFGRAYLDYKARVRRWL
jgi:protein-S-isoprenylcysteine O-methyltransferase Ste14